MRIYPLEYRVRNIIAAADLEGGNALGAWAPRMEEARIAKLNGVLNIIDYDNIKKRRNIYSRLYHEAIISCHRDRGISFTEMLLMLAHHKLIVDREALQ